eukprot:TRINITY_DN30102_c0_g1_i1.p1 TRINITY_DN30102_c0_g1~~TRINITY_DN30102_c0_g1_i1.p1  ORF type:complete len:125 (-),score=34.66 TRINITY_DN30102_c0_g1_i1:170-544(-)
MLYSFKPGVAGRVFPETNEVGPVDDQQLFGVPGKKDLSFLYDMPYHNFKPMAMNVLGKRSQGFAKRDLVMTKKDLRFLYDMLYNDNRPRITPRQSHALLCPGPDCNQVLRGQKRPARKMDGRRY